LSSLFSKYQPHLLRF